MSGGVKSKWNLTYLIWQELTHYHIETSSLTWSGSQWTGFYMIGASIMNELKQ